jgi:hypothetical protein
MEKGGGFGMRKLAVFVAVVVAVLMAVAVFADEQAQFITDLGNWTIWAFYDSNSRAVAAIQNEGVAYFSDARYTVFQSVIIAKILADHIVIIPIDLLSRQIVPGVQMRPLINDSEVVCNITYVGWDNTPISSIRRTMRYYRAGNALYTKLDPLLYSMEAVLSKELRISFETNIGQVTVVVDISNIYRVLTELDIASVGL